MNVDTWDRRLVLRAQSGDRGAFDVLVRKYWHRVMKLAMRYTPNRADAEDLVRADRGVCKDPVRVGHAGESRLVRRTLRCRGCGGRCAARRAAHRDLAA